MAANKGEGFVINVWKACAECGFGASLVLVVRDATWSALGVDKKSRQQTGNRHRLRIVCSDHVTTAVSHTRVALLAQQRFKRCHQLSPGANPQTKNQKHKKNMNASSPRNLLRECSARNMRLVGQAHQKRARLVLQGPQVLLALEPLPALA